MKNPSVLSPETYDSAESEAMRHLPNRLIEAVKPVAFAEVGYPITVNKTSSLRRYAEVVHETRMPQITSFLNGGLRSDEAEAFRSIVEAVAAMSETSFGRRRVPIASLLDAIHIKRHIDFLYPDRRPPVLEIGAGSGYVGSLFMQAGHQYVCTDIAQAFYLYQSHLFRRIGGERFSERVLEIGGPEDAFVHLPWWQFYRIDGVPDLSAEIVTANHCLCEMHPHAAAYVMHLTANLLDRSPTGTLVYFSMGSQILRRATDVLKTMYHYGLRLAHRDEMTTVLIGPKHPEYGQTLEVDFSTLPESTELPGHLSGRISESIIEGRRKTSETIALSMEDVMSCLREVLGSSDLRTDDEVFQGFAALPK
jgi:hypothetical protein